MNKFIILDRDGVINYDSEHYIKSPEEWVPIPGSLEAIAELKQAGFRVVVATNQAGIAYGFYNEETLKLIHQKLLNALLSLGANIDGIFYCPHQASDQCDCRKPKPGLLFQIAKHFNITLSNIPYIGDKKSDIDAANAAGCKPILVKTGYGEKTLLSHPELKIDVYADLGAVVDAVLTGQLTW